MRWASSLRPGVGRDVSPVSTWSDFTTSVTARTESVRIVRTLSGGGGGGKAHLATAGGKENNAIKSAIGKTKELITEKLQG